MSRFEGDWPSISVIVLNYNGKTVLGELFDECLSSVLNTDYPNFRALFADDGSTDGTTEYVERRFQDPKLRIIELNKNYGYWFGFQHFIGSPEERCK